MMQPCIICEKDFMNVGERHNSSKGHCQCIVKQALDLQDEIRQYLRGPTTNVEQYHKLDNTINNIYEDDWRVGKETDGNFQDQFQVDIVDSHWSQEFERSSLYWELEAFVNEDEVVELFLISKHKSIEDWKMECNIRCALDGKEHKSTVVLSKGGLWTKLGAVSVLSFKLELSIDIVDFNLMQDPSVEETERVIEGPKKAGRPPKHLKYRTTATRMMNAFWHHWHGRPFTAQALDELLALVNSPYFEKVAPTRYLLEKCDEFFFEDIPLSSMELTVDGKQHSLKYHNPVDILRHVLASEKLTTNWQYMQSNDDDHPSSSKGWKIYEEAHAIPLQSEDYRLVLGSIWVDKFLGERSRGKSYCQVMVSFANFNKDLLKRQESRFLVCTIPPTLSAKKDQILRDIVIKFFKQLEDGILPAIHFVNEARDFKVIGGLHMVKADHIEKVSLGGIVGPGGDRCSFYTTTHRDDIPNLKHVRKLRTPADAKQVFKELKPLGVTKQKEKITETGYTWPMLPIFARNFFMRFGCCSLHLILLGLVKKYVEEMGKKEGASFRREINDAIDLFTQWPSGLPRITMKVFRKKGPPMALTGKMWHTFARISTAISAPLLSVEALTLWDTVMDCACTIVETNWTKDQIKNGDLRRVIYRFAKAMQESFSTKDDVNWSIPNFETLFVIPDLIAFLGPLWYQGTDLEESINKDARQCLYVSNHKQGAESVMKLMQKRRGILNQISTQDHDSNLFAELFPWAQTDRVTEQEAEEFVPTDYGNDIEIFGKGLTVVHTLLKQFSTNTEKYTLKSTRAVSFNALKGSSKTMLKRGLPIRYFDREKVRIGIIHNLYVIEAMVNDKDYVILPMATVKIPNIFTKYKNLRTKALDLSQAKWNAVPLDWCGFRLVGPATIFLDPRNQKRAFILDRDVDN